MSASMRNARATGFNSNNKNKNNNNSNNNKNNKRKAGGQHGRPNKRARPSAETKKEISVHQLTTWTHDANSAARGQDYPTGFVASKLNAPHLCIVAIRGMSGADGHFCIFSGWKTRYDLYSQSPAIMLMKDFWEIKCYADNNLKHYNLEDKELFLSSAAKATDLDDVGALNETLRERLNLPVTLEQTQAICEFSRSVDSPDRSGFHMRQAFMTGKFHARWNGRYEATRTESADVVEVLNLLNSSDNMVTIFRKSMYLSSEVAAYFEAKASAVVTNGVYPFYRPLIGEKTGSRFQAFWEYPLRLLQHQPWMRNPREKGVKYATHVPRKHYSSIDEWEIRMSVAIVYDMNFQKAIIDRYLVWGKDHVVEVIEKQGRRVLLEVQITLEDDFPLPTVTADSKLKIRPGESLSEMDILWGELPKASIFDNEVYQSRPRDPQADTEQVATIKTSVVQVDEAVEVNFRSHMANEVHVAPYGGIEHKCKVVERQSPKAFIISFVVGKEGKHFYEIGEKMKCQIEMQPNFISHVRQLEAIGAIAKAVSEDKIPAARAIGAMVLGNPIPVADDAPSMLDEAKNWSPELTGSLDRFVDALNLNAQQRETWECTVKGKNPINLVQGPPGTGKTTLDATDIATFAALGHRTIAAAPTNQACEAMLTNLRSTIAVMRSVDPRLANRFKVITKAAVSDTEAGRILGDMIRGNPLPLLPEDHTVYEGRKNREEKVETSLTEYRQLVDLNKEQTNTLETIFKGRSPVVQVQGPPGTGKTWTDGCISVTFAAYGYRIAVTAPTNQACNALALSIVNHLKLLRTVDPELAKSIKVIYLPTISKLRDQMKEKAADDMERLTNDLILDGEAEQKEELRPIMLWPQIVELVKRKAGDKTLADVTRQDYAQWLKFHALVLAGEKLNKKDFRKFNYSVDKLTEDLLSDPNIKIIIATCSTSAQLRLREYKADTLIIDESAFATLPDCAVPLALVPKYIVLSGDHKQLTSNVSSSGHQEESSQLELSPFEFLLMNGNIPLLRLNVNYRMHPRIALLPGMISYGWLGCGKNTKQELDEYRHLALFWDSEEGAAYKAARRAPEFDKKKSPNDVRRMFFNVQKSRSSRAPGTTSQINYANAVAICDIIGKVLSHKLPSDVKPLQASQITILTSYAEQKDTLRKVLPFILKTYGVTDIPTVATIDSYQGDENEVIILDMTAANEHHGSAIGFMLKWNRVNVAITRAKQALWMFGNLDLWRTELQTIVQGMNGTKFAYFMIDLLDIGDIVDVPGVNALPKNQLEAFTRDQWSIIMPRSRILPFNATWVKKAIVYKADKRAQEKFEGGLLKGLNRLRAVAQKAEHDFDKGLEVFTPLFHDIDGMDTDAVKQAATDVGTGEAVETGKGQHDDLCLRILDGS